MPETTSLEAREYLNLKCDIVMIRLKNLICIDLIEEEMWWYDYLSFIHDYYSLFSPHVSLICSLYHVLLLLLRDLTQSTKHIVRNNTGPIHQAVELFLRHISCTLLLFLIKNIFYN